MSDLLSILEMAVGFLSMAGGDPETKICDYLKNVLRLSDGKSNLKSKKVGNISSSYVFFRGHGNESCNLIGSLPGQYFPISAHGPR